ncbi:TetR/AcrR family transcriptional regulator [Streptomyces antibioticus]|uniref:TetR/AcrR family transcriptional regulator n=1 Tax=Streptomyces antibioticus TaxID=1890 RepID=UPI003695DFF7
MAATAEPQRRHARANRRRILDAARETLSADPDTTVEDIARAAGVARRTLYGHFANRDALLEALADDAVRTLRQAFIDRGNPEEPPDLALARVMMTVWGIGDRYRMLIALASRDLGGGITGAPAPVRERAVELLSDGQRSGVFTDHLPTPVLAHVLESTIVSMLESVNRDTWQGSASAAATTVLMAAGKNRSEADALIRLLRTEE